MKIILCYHCHKLIKWDDEQRCFVRELYIPQSWTRCHQADDLRHRPREWYLKIIK